MADTPHPVEDVVSELQRPGCPQVFDRLTPQFQKAFPRSGWAGFCSAFSTHGDRRSLVATGNENGFAVYRLAFERAEFKLGLAFDEQGRISGLFARPWLPVAVADSGVRYRWPLLRATTVFWGGSDAASNQHVKVPRQQRATDLVVVGADGRTHTGAGHANSEYLIEGGEVVAAADGKVIVVVDGIPENEPGAMDDTLLPGNVIAIEHGPSEFGHYCHLQPGSARVKPGDLVKAGQVIGLVGNSGNSSEPHLHFHVQTSPHMAEGLGVDPIFSGVCLIDGKVQRAAPLYRLHKGDVVVPCGGR